MKHAKLTLAAVLSVAIVVAATVAQCEDKKTDPANPGLYLQNENGEWTSKTCAMGTGNWQQEKCACVTEEAKCPVQCPDLKGDPTNTAWFQEKENGEWKKKPCAVLGLYWQQEMCRCYPPPAVKRSEGSGKCQDKKTDRANPWKYLQMVDGVWTSKDCPKEACMWQQERCTCTCEEATTGEDECTDVKADPGPENTAGFLQMECGEWKKKPCAELGIYWSQKMCRCYPPDVHAAMATGADHVAPVTSLITWVCSVLCVLLVYWSTWQ